MNNREIDLTPPTSIYGFFKKLSYTFEQAIAELIDNSVASFRDNEVFFHGKEKHITIVFDNTNKRIIVRDTAYGIKNDKWERVLRLMDGKAASETSLNEFGMGLKTSGFWLGNKISIISKHVNETTGYSVEMSLEQFDNNLKTATVKPNDKYAERPFYLEHGTFVFIDGVDKQMQASILKETLVPFFASKYRKDITKGLQIRMILNENNKQQEYIDLVKFYGDSLKKEECIINKLNYVTTEPLVYKYPKLYVHEGKEQKVEVEIKMVLNSKEYTAKGWLGNLEKGGYKKTGLSLLRRNNVIIQQYKHEKLFGASNSEISLRLIGELNFSDDMPVTQAKDKFDWGNGLEEMFLDEMLKNKNYLDIRRLAQTARRADNKVNEFTPKDIKEQCQDTVDHLSQLEGIKVRVLDQKIVQEEIGEYISRNNTDFALEIETDTIRKKVVSRLAEGSPRPEDWIILIEKDDYTIVEIDMNHAFFNPFNEQDKKFLKLIRTFSCCFAIGYFETEKAGEGVDGFRERLGKFLAKNIKND